MNKVTFLLAAVFFMTTLIYGVGPPTVNLGTAGNYTILTSTGVSTTGTTSIVGDIGVSPVAASYITGFGLTLHSSGTYSTSSLVTGRIYAADYTPPTPGNLTTAVNNLVTAYNDAAGRPNPDYTELYAGDLTGQTLIPGLYKWSTSVLISAAGMTIAGGPNDIWIFQIAQNLTLANGAIITLSGGARPENIFWQIAGHASIGTTAQFKGIALCQTLISLNTGATVNGRLLAQTAVTLDQNTVVHPTFTTSVSEDAIPPVNAGSSLEPNYPNPFYLNTNIKFNIIRGEHGILSVYNAKGQSVLHQAFESGNYEYSWSASGLPSGYYMYRLQTNSKDIIKSMIQLK